MRPSTRAELAGRLRRRDIHRLAEGTMRLALRAFRHKKVRRVILDLDSTLVESGVRKREDQRALFPEFD
ncbi:MAG: hypothetical protein ACUVV5_08650 [Candidatus Aminicenantales bacterium]